jgi:hypothetical protein
MAGVLLAIYILVGLLGHLLSPASKRVEKAKTIKIKVKELKKTFFKTLQHKIFPHMALFTMACVADDTIRMVWEVYRYDMDAVMSLIIPKNNGVIGKLETSIKINGQMAQESVVQYNNEKDALEAFDKFCHAKFDLYQYVYNNPVIE